MLIHSEPLAHRHHAACFSAAFCFRLLLFLGTILVSYALALAPGDFWLSQRNHLEQPTVRFLYDLAFIVETNIPGEERAWTSFDSARSALEAADKLLHADVEAQEHDYDKDGKSDAMDLKVTAHGVAPVHGVKIAAAFSYQLSEKVAMTMQSLAFASASSPLPGRFAYFDGDLRLRQTDLLAEDSKRTAYNTSVFHGWGREMGELRDHRALRLDELLSNTNLRNESIYFDTPAPVWITGGAMTGTRAAAFTCQLRVRIPRKERVTTTPSRVSMMKDGWIQFLAIFLAVNFAAGRLKNFVFHVHVFPTRVMSDVGFKRHL